MAQINARKVVLENGMQFGGTGFGAARDVVCEMVFDTAMVGYQEVVTDPSFTEQIVVMTYPLIGNYGITDEDYETRVPTLGGMVVREYNDLPSNFRYTKTLSEIMEENGIPGIQGVDTRQITKILRESGVVRAMITDESTPLEEALRRIRHYQAPIDCVGRVSCKKKWYARTPNHRYHVVAVDCGIKLNIVRCLNDFGCNVTVVPYTTSYEEILAMKPDGVLISNGPGDPHHVTAVIELIGQLRGKLPMFGICMGHLLMALALGAKCVRMKHGHHGGNHPVKNLQTGKLVITGQNHNYMVDPDSLPGTGLEVTEINVLDGTIEGMECAADKLFCVQYHPEGAPGPNDSLRLFEQFIAIMAKEGQ